MSRTDTSAWPCTIARTADLLGDEWDLLIVRQACLGARRFEDFRAGLGIGRNVLTNHLSRLVDQGVFSRDPYQERPLRHHYRLTDKGFDATKTSTGEPDCERKFTLWELAFEEAITRAATAEMELDGGLLLKGPGGQAKLSR